MKRTLWVISELYYPEATSTGYILTRIAEGLSQKFVTNVICGQPTYSARGTRVQTHEHRNGVNIRRYWGTTLNKDVLPLRLVNLLTITVSLFLAALRNLGRGDLALVVTNPPALPFVIAVACKLRRAKCSLIVHDVYPDLAIAAGKLSATSFTARFLNQLNRWLYQSMECIFVLGRDMQNRVADKLAKGKERVVVATNWADLDVIAPVDRTQNTLLRELDLTDKFVLQYAGNMGYPNDIESIIAAAVSLKSHKDVHFLFIGSGAKKHQIKLAVQRHDLDNVTILDPRPRSDQSNFLNACDVALIALVAGMKGVSVPSRTYNTLAAGKPIIGIAEANSELALIIEEERVGWVVPPGQPEALANMILEAKAQQDLLDEMRSRARAAAESKYSFDTVLKVFQDNLPALS